VSPASDRQVELGEAQRAVILAELRHGAVCPSDLCTRLGLHSGTVQRHLARLMRAGVVFSARGVASTGPRAFYALTQADADAALAGLGPVRAPAPRTVAIPPPPPSETRVAARMLPIYGGRYAQDAANAAARARGVERRDQCEGYAACLDRVPHAAVDARCPRECPGFSLDPAESREARLLAATARVTFDSASQYPSTRGLGQNDHRHG